VFGKVEAVRGRVLMAGIRSRVARPRARAQAMAEFAVTSVVLLFTVVAIIDLALWLQAQNVVIAASQEAAAVGSRGDGTSTQGVAAGWNLLRAGLGSGVSGIDRVEVRIGTDSATAEVRGTWHVAPLGPLVPVPLHATTTILREQFRPGGR
jgi:TadE-like protein